MLTCEHDAGSISKFLIDFRIFASETHVWPFFKAIVIDWSWPPMNAIVSAWNNTRVIDYINATYDYSVDNQQLPHHYTILLSCIAYIMHIISKKIGSDFAHMKGVKDFLLDVCGLILLSRDILQDAIFEEF